VNQQTQVSQDRILQNRHHRISSSCSPHNYYRIQYRSCGDHNYPPAERHSPSLSVSWPMLPVVFHHFHFLIRHTRRAERQQEKDRPLSVYSKYPVTAIYLPPLFFLQSPPILKPMSRNTKIRIRKRTLILSYAFS
jgi:hypothetical protein